MKVHNIQIIKDNKGLPEYVVIPYYQYNELFGKKIINKSIGIPSEVVDLMFDKKLTILRAWREFLDLTQTEVADKLNMSQSAYAQYELKEKLTKKARIKLAKALGIQQEQLDC